ncbi:MAG: aminopeptidase P family protein [Methylobacteriaceae bacterium]|nr:aminopeptidase P family protein [Methylobacteriaceae bacterium]
MTSVHSDRLTRSNIANIDRLNHLMDRDGIAAVVVRGGQNVTYLAGISFHGTLARHLDLAASGRGVAVVWPREGEPVFVVEATGAGPVDRDSWIERVEIFSGYHESLFERIARVLQDLRLDRARVGFDKNFIGAGFWEDLAGRLPNMKMVDSARLMDEVRWIKTPGEVSRFKSGAAVLDRVFYDVFPTILAGEREREAHGRLIGACLAQGAEFAHGIFNSHRNPRIYCGESDFVLQRGDIIRTDYLAYVDGYPGHQSRNAVIGRPSSEQEENYQKYFEVYLTTAERLRPGTTVGELYDFVVEAFRRIGWTYTAGLVGHSVGPWWHQQEPIFCRGGSKVLEPGMVVALEPFLDHWHCQDLFLITSGAPELLSPDFDTRRMFVID